MDPNNPVQTEIPPLPIPPTSTPTPSPTPVLCDYSVQSGDIGYLAQSIEEANTTPESFENICLAVEGFYSVESPDASGYALPAITSEIAIIGNGSTLARDSETTDEFGIFRVENSGTLYLSNLTLGNGYNSGGSEPSGGAISNAGTVVVTGSTLENNTAVEYGGAIFNTGALTLIDSTITGNTAINYGGGGIRSTDGIVEIINSEVSGNFRVEPGADNDLVDGQRNGEQSGRLALHGVEEERRQSERDRRHPRSFRQAARHRDAEQPAGRDDPALEHQWHRPRRSRLVNRFWAAAFAATGRGFIARA